ncbi:MAG TPA: outer membrane protein assembly factor BamB [Gammaproteobacteria bacterium]
MIRTPVVLLLTLSLCACAYFGDEDNAIPPTPLEEIENTVSIKENWSRDAGGGADEAYLNLGPVYSENKVFVANSNGKVVAYDAETGKRLWQFDTDTYLTGGPGVGENLVLVGSGDAEVIAIDAESGKLVWRVPVSSEVLAAPAVSADIVVARTIDGKTVGLNASTGQKLWTYEQSVPALSLRGTSAPIIDEELVIVGYDEGRLVALEEQTGKLVWETRIALGSGRSELERMVDIDAEPVIDSGVIFVATFQGRLAALSLVAGSILWTREISTHTGLSVDSSNVYITDDDSNVWALDRFNGNSIWKLEKLAARAVTAPAVHGNLIAVGDIEGYLHWLDKATGEIVARDRLSDNRIIAAPVVHAGTVYFYSSDGTLAAYSFQE